MSIIVKDTTYCGTEIVVIEFPDLGSAFRYIQLELENDDAQSFEIEMGTQ